MTKAHFNTQSFQEILKIAEQQSKNTTNEAVVPDSDTKATGSPLNMDTASFVRLHNRGNEDKALKPHQPK